MFTVRGEVANSTLDLCPDCLIVATPNPENCGRIAVVKTALLGCRAQDGSDVILRTILSSQFGPKN
jgi:hypothetical protein